MNQIDIEKVIGEFENVLDLYGEYEFDKGGSWDTSRSFIRANNARRDFELHLRKLLDKTPVDVV